CVIGLNESTPLRLLACFILTVDLTLGSGPNKDVEFTFLLSAGSTECFYQTTARNDSLEVEYQVTAGSGLDVGFVLISPSGYQLVSDFRRSDAIHMTTCGGSPSGPASTWSSCSPSPSLKSTPCDASLMTPGGRTCSRNAT
uniref:Transmembrane p24 trafficking protein 1a n=1 Tax=Cyclopterus lumpus TaxID=8103 RepID=A0A8C2YZX5_CYCLU